MLYKKKIKELITSNDAQARMLGYGILMGKLSTSNVVDWFYILGSVPATTEQQAVGEYIRQQLGVGIKDRMSVLSNISEYIQRNLTNIDAESLNHHFYMVNKNLLSYITKNHSMSNSDERELESKIKSLEIYATEFNEGM
jgi:uncharacterized protein YeeX (DUF496 family)